MVSVTPAPSHLLSEVMGGRSESRLLPTCTCVLLLAALIAAPLAFGAVQPWAWAALAVTAVVLLLLWAIAAVRQVKLRVAWSPLYVPVALFLLLASIQFLGHLTFDPFASRESLLKLTTDLLFFFLAGQLLTVAPDGMWRALGLTALTFAVLLALFAILQFFSGPELIYWSVRPRWGGWVFGPYVNHNHYAGLMEMLIPLATAYVLSRQNHDARNTLLRFALVLLLASVLLSGSRGGLIALLVEVLILSAIYLRQVPKGGRRSFVLLAGLGIAATLLSFAWMDPGTISRRLATAFQFKHSPEVEVGFVERKTVAWDSLRILRDHPWLGTGLGSFENAYPPYQTLASDFVWVHAHNDYAEAVAETGLAGGVLILSALGMFFRLAFGHLRERLTREAGWIQLGTAVGCCGLLVHSFFDFNLHIPANAAWFAVCAASATCGLMERIPRNLPRWAGEGRKDASLHRGN